VFKLLNRNDTKEVDGIIILCAQKLDEPAYKMASIALKVKD
jgi:hypothetical protein